MESTAKASSRRPVIRKRQWRSRVAESHARLPPRACGGTRVRSKHRHSSSESWNSAHPLTEPNLFEDGENRNPRDAQDEYKYASEFARM
jgi:hypothetical protein